jgi:predicted permease
LLFGLSPALGATRIALLSALKDEGSHRGGRTRRLRHVFVGGQVALTLLLLVAAGLFVRSLQRAATLSAGFDPTGVHVLFTRLEIDGYDAVRGAAFQQLMLDRLRATPGVAAAALAIDLPLDMSAHESPVYPEGWSSPAGDDRNWIQAAFNRVSTGYFATLGIPLLQGRDFAAADRANTEPVAIVSRTLAERAWPGEPALGKRIRFSDRDAEELTVVGVAGDVKNQTVSEGGVPMIYMPLAQHYDANAALLVRGAGPAAPALILRTVRSLDPQLSLTPVQSVADYTSLGILPQRMAAIIAGALGALALVLSALGIYGVVAFAVTQRTREVGVRLALGARPRDVVRTVVAGGLRTTLPGMGIGAALAVALGFALRSFLLGVPAADPITLTIAVVVVLAILVFACWIPARRAARIEPIVALRSE